MSVSVGLALAAQLLLWLMVIGVFLASRQASIFHPLTFYLGFHGLAFVVRPSLVHFLGFDSLWNYMVFEPAEADQIKTLAVSSIALIVFAAASVWAGRSNVTFVKARTEPVTPAEWRTLILVTVLLAPVVAYSIIRSNTGGFQGELRGSTFVLTGDSGYVLEAQFMATPLLCIWLAATRFKWQGLVLLALYVGYRAYWGWMRSTLVLFLAAVAMAYCWEHRRKWLPFWMLLLAIPVIMLFHALGQRRGMVQAFFRGESISEIISESEGQTATLSARDRYRVKYDTQDYANFDYLTFVLATVPRKTGTYSYGTQYLQLFTEPIPRKLWAGKPLGGPVSLLNLNAYGRFVGLTVSLAGDGWLSGGWIGLIVTMAFFGWIWGRFHRWFWANIDRGLCAMLYMIALSMSPQHFRDGGISIAKFLFWNLSPVILWAAVSWLMGSRLVPSGSKLLPGGARLRFLTPVASGPGRTPIVPGSHPGREGAASPRTR